MKKKLSLIALAFAMFAILAISALLFSGCDSLLGNDDNGKPDNGNNGGNAPCAHTWEWVITTPPPDEGEDAVEKDSIATQRCKKCEATGRTVTIPVGSDVNEILSEFEEDASEDSGGNDEIEINDDELERILSSAGTNPDAVVGPLLAVKWNQRFPFNNLFPLAPGHAKANAKGELPTDCGSTAVVQIMAFHKHPIQGTGQSTVLGPHGITTPPVDLNSVAYDWNNMLDHYRSDGKNSTEQQRNAVAVLFLHHGMARGLSGDVPNRLTTYFGYDRSIQRIYRNFYTDADWAAIIKKQLDLGLPVYYYSLREGGGHAFVIDGYDSQGRFHVNWGWGGAYDGWYPLNGLRPREGRLYDRDQRIVINIKPDQGSTGSHEMGLNSFTANKTTVTQNEFLTVTANVRSFGYFTGGQVGVALTNTTSGAVEAVAGTASYGSRIPNSSRTTTMRIIVPYVTPGNYDLRIVTRETGGEWKIVTAANREAGIPNAIPITIIPETGTPGGGYGLSLREFSTDKTTAGRNESFAVTVNFYNRSAEQFPGGTAGVVLVDNDGYIVGEAIGTRSRGTLSPGSRWSSPVTINCTIPYYGIEPGNYRLRIAVKTATGDWRIASLAEEGVPTAIVFTVTSGVRSPFLNFFHSVAAYRSATNNIEVVINQSLTIDQLVSIPAPATAGATLTIRSANPSQPVTLTRGVSGNLFTVTNGATLILKDIIIDGASNGAFADNSGGALVRLNGGSFTMNAGTVLRNNTNTNTATATLGGGVNANTNSTFTMNAGTISGNIAGGNGGGLVVTNSAVSTINGGEISGNRGANGGGVRISAGGVLTLVNGKINNNTATATSGGVSVSGAGSTLNLDGGEINGNTATTNGGGVILESSSTFTMNSGTVSGNTATAVGGGVYVNNNCTFTMNSGMINGNNAGGNGGGLVVTNSAVSTMNGGEISDNNGTTGGGVRISAKGVFTLVNGKIINNTARSDGGGVSVADTSSIFNINGGEISGNIAGTVGGGVSVTSSAASTMTGGEISGNRGTDGGGVRASGSGVFTLANGKIINNTATSGVGSGISSASSAGSIFNLNGGVVAGTGTALTNVVSGTHNLNTGEGATNNAVIIAWNRASGTLNYTVGSSTDLTVSPDNATAVWEDRGGVLGISYSYANGSNTGWISQW